MRKNKKQVKVEFLIPITSVDRMQRWQICQYIGKLYYDAEISFDMLLQIKEYMEKNGVLTK